MSIIDTIKNAVTGGSPQPQPAAQPTEPSPPDFSTLFTGEAPKAPEPINAQIYNTDPAQLQEQLKSKDFTPQNFGELAARATSGDVAALQELLNTSVQNAVAFATQASANLAENAAIKVGERATTALPQQVKELQVDAILGKSIPGILSNPAFAPQVQNAKLQILRMNPEATPDQIANLTTEYLKQFSTTINPALNIEPTPKQKPAQPVMSLSEFFRRV